MTDDFPLSPSFSGVRVGRGVGSCPIQKEESHLVLILWISWEIAGQSGNILRFRFSFREEKRLQSPHLIILQGFTVGFQHKPRYFLHISMLSAMSITCDWHYTFPLEDRTGWALNVLKNQDKLFTKCETMSLQSINPTPTPTIPFSTYFTEVERGLNKTKWDKAAHTEPGV